MRSKKARMISAYLAYFQAALLITAIFAFASVASLPVIGAGINGKYSLIQTGTGTLGGAYGVYKAYSGKAAATPTTPSGPAPAASPAAPAATPPPGTGGTPGAGSPAAASPAASGATPAPATPPAAQVTPPPGAAKTPFSPGAGLGALIISAAYAYIASTAVIALGKAVDSDFEEHLAGWTAGAAFVSTYVGVTAGAGAYAALDVTGHVAITHVLSEAAGGIFAPAAGVFVPAIIIAAVAAIIYYAITESEKYKEETIAFKCMLWQAPVKGKDCERCNKNPLKPCTEYRCRALGQACGIINVGTDNEKCIWINPRDTTSPGIKPWKEVLTSGNEYDSVVERPPGKGGPAGMKIVKAGGGCINAFTPIEFGIKTSEAAQCKIDYKHKDSFNDMGYYINENSLYVGNHSQKISLPGTELLKTLAPEAQNDGNYNLYLRCRDGNGNENRDEFVVSFCVDKGPDVTAPVIKGTGPLLNGMPVQYGIDNVSLNVYTNEPAECAWSRTDADYNSMENNMSCSNKVWEMNAELLYTCAATLTKIEDRKENVFYFRCKDNPGLNESKRNANRQSYKFGLFGTQPLDIIKTGPNETSGGSTSVVTATLEVETDNGHKNGEAVCYYSATGEEGSYIEMYETGGNVHKQPLDLPEGSYDYYFMCVDAGGNSDTGKTEFSIIVDNAIPSVVRAYNENDKLKIATNEKASCKYSVQSCNYDFTEGIAMTASEDSRAHYAEWKTTQNYYIKCSDEYDNMPDPSMCSIIVKLFGY